jgi:GDPmannose 4,6-dehydratase
MTRALITGAGGQDGAFLARLLCEKGYEVHGTVRPGESGAWRLRALGIVDRVTLTPLDVRERTAVPDLIRRVAPDEIYNLAGQSSIGKSFGAPLVTAEVNGLGAVRILETVREVGRAIKVFQASSSEIEDMDSPYAAAMAFAHALASVYRRVYGVFVCCGILFNHESPLRTGDFVSKKIVSAAARIKAGLETGLALGQLDSRRDWGYAPEYVEAMWLMLQRNAPADYVIATGESHSVREFTEAAFRHVGLPLEWRGRGLEETGHDAATGRMLVRIAPEFYRAAREDRRADPSGTTAELGWTPRTDFETLVRLMVDHEVAALRDAEPAAPQGKGRVP